MSQNAGWVFVGAVFLGATLGCSSPTIPPVDTGTTTDSGRDAAATSDTGVDARVTLDDAGVDASITTDDTGVDAAAPDEDGGTDAAASVDGGTRSDSGVDSGLVTSRDASVDAARGAVHYCTSDGGCTTGETCHLSFCSPTSPQRGFCTETGRGGCGGFGGLRCPDTGATVCLDQGACVADALGICVTPAEHDDICAHQSTLWGCR